MFEVEDITSMLAVHNTEKTCSFPYGAVSSITHRKCSSEVLMLIDSF